MQNNTNKIITFHIGGRAGSIGFPENNKYNHEIEKIIFEADEDCIDQIKDIHPNGKTLNFFIGKNNEKINFNINYCPYTSSSYSLNPEFENFYHKHVENTDYVLKHVMKTQKTIPLISRSLDSLCSEKITPTPDFLSIDTQGSEFDILQNSDKIIKENVLAISCEINFNNLYLNIKLFPEIHNFLLDRDFILVDIEGFNIGYHRLPTKFRGKGIPLQGEALYLKNPKKVGNSKNKELILRKLAFIAISFGYTELAFKTIELSNLQEQFKTDYEKFLLLFYYKITKEKGLPKLWNEKFSFKESLYRFTKESNFSNKNKNLYFKVKNKIFNIFQKSRSLDLSFADFLSNNGFNLASKEIRKRIEGKL